MHDRRGPPTSIEVRGARVNNLNDLALDVPLGRFVALTGVSGSGKSSLAMGVLYAEGSRRYLDGLPTFARRRITQAMAPDVDSIDYLPAALALRQRPPVPGPRSTVGTMTEVNAVLRLAMSRLGTHLCPNGHAVRPNLQTWATERITCPTCGETAPLPSAESFSFNTHGACPTCQGLGVTKEVDRERLVVDDALSLTDGAIGPWRMLGRSHMPLVAAELGVRTDVPWRDLTPDEQRLVIDGPGHPVRKHIVIRSGTGRPFPLNAEYESAIDSVRKMAGNETGSGRTGAERYLVSRVCPTCQGNRLSPTALTSRLAGLDLAAILATPLRGLTELADAIETEATATSPALTPTAGRLAGELRKAVSPLLALGLGYLSPDRAGETLSTGERQRIQLQSTAMRRTTGMLYVLDEPSIGLHPSAVEGLITVLFELVADGNSLVVVDHDIQILDSAEQLIELGPDAGGDGGQLVAQGPPTAVAALPESRIGPYITGAAQIVVRERRAPSVDLGVVAVDVSQLFNLDDVAAQFPVNRMTAVTGVSGAGKTALVLDSLVPGVLAEIRAQPRPRHVRTIDPVGIDRVVVVDATPIGANDRSTPATYSGAFDEIRTLFATTDLARERGWNKGRFSYNTPAGRCPVCEGLGELELDLQYLPDLPVTCPECHGDRYNPETLEAVVDGRSIAGVLHMTVTDARDWFARLSRRPDAQVTGRSAPLRRLQRILATLEDVGLGYLTLGEPTPALSGGEAQRLRLATELRRRHDTALFVFDEPTIGLHPRDVATLVGVLDRIVEQGGTVIVVEHDLDLVANADWIIDMGPEGGDAGGRIVATGTVDELRADPVSVIGPWLDRHLGRGD